MPKLNVIGLLGKSKSGKDTSGRMLLEMGNGAQLAFADKLKSIAMEMYGLSHEQAYDEIAKEKPTKLPCLLCPECRKTEVELFTQEHVKNARCLVCGIIGSETVFKGFWTPRTILQYLGTECFRKIDSSVWVRYALDQAEARLGDPLKRRATDTSDRKPVDFVAITDCRFKSEMEAIHAIGGEVWRLRRPDTDGKPTGIKGHASEDEMDSIADSSCNAVIINDATLDVLKARLQAQFNRFTNERKSSE